EVSMRPIVALAFTLLLGACASSGPTASDSSYVVAYERGDHARALTRAEQAALEGTPSERDQAALIAGLAAHALGDDTRAERWLRPLLDHDDRHIRGRAMATIGLVELDRGHHEDAARMLQRAGLLLTGEDSAHAFLSAGDAYTAAGQRTSARRAYEEAISRADGDPDLEALARAKLVSKPWALQFGAFRTRDAAERRLQSIRSTVVTIEDLDIVESSRGGQTLFLIRGGSYVSKADASDALRKTALEGFVTTRD
ncbi:MAG: SPOR domain-containing protein, partial [Phycisphaerales bacterium]|nr:SPOR domain-containing protein [Phycisphaerales bacterium]